MHRKGLCVLGVLAAVGGCHEDANYDAWQRLLDQIDAEGHMSLHVARAAFSLAIAPLPGVELPRGRRRTVPCAKLAADAMYLHYDALTDAERAILVAATAPPGAPTKSPAARKRPAGFMPANPLFAGWVNEAKQKYLLETKTPDFPIAVYESNTTHPQYGEDALAQSLGFNDMDIASGPMTKCVIMLYPRFSTVSAAEQKETAYHETFHCIQSSMFPSIEQEVAAPTWLKEGAAEWAATTVLNQALLSGDAWERYITDGQRSLYERANDAIGFFAQLQADHLEPFPRMPDIVTGFVNGDSTSALSAAISTNSGFFSRWATSYVRKPAFGVEWDIYGVGVPGIGPDEASIVVRDGSTHADGISPAANRWFLVDLSADVVRFRTPAGSRLRKSDGSFDGDPFGDWCVNPGGCKCPAESPFALEVLPTIPDGGYYLTLPGRFKGAPWSVLGQTKEKHCNRDLIDPCLVGTWELDDANVVKREQTPCKWPRPIGALLNIDGVGIYNVDIEPMVSIVCESSGPDPSYVMQFHGNGTGVFSTADNGYAQGMADISGLIVDVSANGMPPVTLPFSTIFPSDVLVGNGMVNYVCTSATLSMWTDANISTFRRR